MKIAICGSAPSSLHLAPFKDPSWVIWGCSPGGYPKAAQERVDAWFEIHRWEPPQIGLAHLQVPWFTPEYVQWLKQLDCPVFTGEPILEIPMSTRLPREQLQQKYGPYFFTSTIAWMLAMALEQPGVEEIGLWGVDMAATEEWAEQRPGCHYFLMKAMERGVTLTIPLESDLMQAPMQYGVDEWDPMMVKMTARLKELKGRQHNATITIQNATAEMHFLNGAIDNINYVIKTWVSNHRLLKLATQPAVVVPADWTEKVEGQPVVVIADGEDPASVVTKDFSKADELA